MRKRWSRADLAWGYENFGGCPACGASDGPCRSRRGHPRRDHVGRVPRKNVDRDVYAMDFERAAFKVRSELGHAL